MEKKNPTEDQMRNLPIIDPELRGRKLTEKEEKWLREMVTCEFTNLEEPGLMHGFTYGNPRNKAHFTFLHGAKYRVPRFIARHVNSRGTPLWKYQPDGNGRIGKVKTGTKARFQMRETMDL